MPVQDDRGALDLTRGPYPACREVGSRVRSPDSRDGPVCLTLTLTLTLTLSLSLNAQTGKH